MDETTLEMTVPLEAIGMWQRESIKLDDGSIDASTRVFWAQTASCFIDLRVPANRIECSLESLSSLSESELASLGGQKGFSGHIVARGPTFTWHRTIDFRPPNGRLDTGTVRITGDTLLEEGDPSAVLGIGYLEIYHRRLDGCQRRVALDLLSADAGTPFAAGVKASLALIDGCFMFAKSRSHDLTQSETLTEMLLPARGNQTKLGGLLDCHIAKGVIEASAGRWMIDLSTHPWSEGKPLFSPLSASVLENRLSIDHGLGNSVWAIRDSNVAPEDLARLF